MLIRQWLMIGLQIGSGADVQRTLHSSSGTSWLIETQVPMIYTAAHAPKREWSAACDILIYIDHGVR